MSIALHNVKKLVFKEKREASPVNSWVEKKNQPKTEATTNKASNFFFQTRRGKKKAMEKIVEVLKVAASS